MEIKEQYCQPTQAKRIVFSENKRRIEFLNGGGKPCYKVKVDGGVLHGDIPKCDYMLVVTKSEHPRINQREQEHYVELKGVDVRHAIEQIQKTIPLLKTSGKVERRSAYIVCASVAPAVKTHIQNARLHLLKAHQCSLQVGEKLNPKI